MLQVVKRLVVVVGVVAMSGCDQLDPKGFIMPTGDGVDKRFEQSAQMTAQMSVEGVDACEEYCFYVCTDPHINQTYKNLATFNDVLRGDAEASFGVILGDCTDVRDNIQTYLTAVAYNPDKHSFDRKIFHILGNHDVFFNGWNDFRDNVGPSVYWFEVTFAEGKDLYIALDTATGTLGRRQTEWLRGFLSRNRDKYRHCVVLTHTNLFYTDNSQTGSGNMPIEESLLLVKLFGKYDVSLVLQGHDHYREDVTCGGVRYVVIGTIRDESKSPEYLKVKVSAEGISLDWQLDL